MVLLLLSEGEGAELWLPFKGEDWKETTGRYHELHIRVTLELYNGTKCCTTINEIHGNMLIKVSVRTLLLAEGEAEVKSWV